MSLYSKLEVMNLVQMTTNTNRVKNAERKLNLHKAKGQHSSLSIFQVAKLMDIIRMGEDVHVTINRFSFH